MFVRSGSLLCVGEEEHDGPCVGYQGPWTYLLPLALFVLTASWIAVGGQCLAGSDVLMWRSFYAMRDRAWRAHYREMFNWSIREILCCMGRARPWDEVDDEVDIVASLLGDVMAYRAVGASHLELLAGLALLQANRPPPAVDAPTTSLSSSQPAHLNALPSTSAATPLSSATPLSAATAPSVFDSLNSNTTSSSSTAGSSMRGIDSSNAGSGHGVSRVSSEGSSSQRLAEGGPFPSRPASVPISLVEEAAALLPLAIAAYTGPLLDMGRYPFTFACAWVWRQGMFFPWQQSRYGMARLLGTPRCKVTTGGGGMHLHSSSTSTCRPPLLGRRGSDRSDVGQVRCGAGQMWGRSDVGQVRCGAGQMWGRSDVGQVRCGAGGNGAGDILRGGAASATAGGRGSAEAAGQAVYFVVVLHQLRLVVVAVRGTESLEDMIIDGLGRECPLSDADMGGIDSEAELGGGGSERHGVSGLEDIIIDGLGRECPLSDADMVGLTGEWLAGRHVELLRPTECDSSPPGPPLVIDKLVPYFGHAGVVTAALPASSISPLASPVPFPPRSELHPPLVTDRLVPYFGHAGVVTAARDLALQLDNMGDGEDEEGEVGKAGSVEDGGGDEEEGSLLGQKERKRPRRGILSELLGEGGECEGYGLRLVGHSMGGAVCSLTAIRLRKRFPELQAIGYGSMPCVDFATASACSNFITTFVYNDEFSPATSVASVMRLRAAALRAVAAGTRAGGLLGTAVAAVGWDQALRAVTVDTTILPRPPLTACSPSLLHCPFSPLPLLPTRYSFVYNDEFSPRTSVASVMRLRAAALRAVAADTRAGGLLGTAVAAVGPGAQAGSTGMRAAAVDRLLSRLFTLPFGIGRGNEGNEMDGVSGVGDGVVGGAGSVGQELGLRNRSGGPEEGEEEGEQQQREHGKPKLQRMASFARTAAASAASAASSAASAAAHSARTALHHAAHLSTPHHHFAFHRHWGQRGAEEEEEEQVLRHGLHMPRQWKGLGILPTPTKRATAAAGTSSAAAAPAAAGSSGVAVAAAAAADGTAGASYALAPSGAVAAAGGSRLTGYAREDYASLIEYCQAKGSKGAQDWLRENVMPRHQKKKKYLWGRWGARRGWRGRDEEGENGGDGEAEGRSGVGERGVRDSGERLEGVQEVESKLQRDSASDASGRRDSDGSGFKGNNEEASVASSANATSPAAAASLVRAASPADTASNDASAGEGDCREDNSAAESQQQNHHYHHQQQQQQNHKAAAASPHKLPPLHHGRMKRSLSLLSHLPRRSSSANDVALAAADADGGGSGGSSGGGWSGGLHWGGSGGGRGNQRSGAAGGAGARRSASGGAGNRMGGGVTDVRSPPAWLVEQEQEFPGEVYVLGKVVHIVREEVRPATSVVRTVKEDKAATSAVQTVREDKGATSAAGPPDADAAPVRIDVGNGNDGAICIDVIEGDINEGDRNGGARQNGNEWARSKDEGREGVEMGERSGGGERGERGEGDEGDAGVEGGGKARGSGMGEMQGGMQGGSQEERVLEAAAAKPGLLESFRSLAGNPFASSCHRARFIPRESLRDLLVSPSMFLDHLPWRYALLL
ncbi:unnamed protein product [Closterium sp. NIES-64]|nr:unnamed protein product [Closterium sp. NIES-64]